MKTAGPSIDDGIVSFQDDPWKSGQRDSFLIDPDGQVYHWESSQGTHSQAWTAIQYNGERWDALDPNIQYDYENLGTDGLTTSRIEGWTDGFIDYANGELWFVNEMMFAPDQYPVIANMIESIQPREVNLVEGEEHQAINPSEAIQYFSGVFAAAGDNLKMVERSLQDTNFSSVPTEANWEHGKFVYDCEGNFVFWTPPFEEFGEGKMFGPIFEKYQDYPIHDHVAAYFGINGGQGCEGLGYITEGTIYMYSDDAEEPISTHAAKVYELFGGRATEFWYDHEEIPLESLKQVTAARDPKRQKRRERRHKYRVKNRIWSPWGGVVNPGAVDDTGEEHHGGGTTENSTGGDFGGGGMSMTATVEGISTSPIPGVFNRWMSTLDGMMFADASLTYHHEMIDLYLNNGGTSMKIQMYGIANLSDNDAYDDAWEYRKPIRPGTIMGINMEGDFIGEDEIPSEIVSQIKTAGWEDYQWTEEEMAEEPDTLSPEYNDQLLVDMGVLKNQSPGTEYERFWAFDDDFYMWDATSYGTGMPPQSGEIDYYHGDVGLALDNSSEPVDDAEYPAKGYYNRNGKGRPPSQGYPNTWTWDAEEPTESQMVRMQELEPDSVGVFVVDVMDYETGYAYWPFEASNREEVLQAGLNAMGYVGCFWCRRSIDEVNDIKIGRYQPHSNKISNLVPCCDECQSKYEGQEPEDILEDLER